ncbi:pyridoxal-dependent decarboxylase [Nocardia sp. BSTN01]|uniref:pyridoxal phosphate-dependent decarboxylase family protein n=1 Tax=Nocardia sp. BSTN01 TaxID=2783665 RepID=UPI001E380D26|nr:pyridoxal-dependent decarboxylase [Nocardia sp. BSTN01]
MYDHHRIEQIVMPRKLNEFIRQGPTADTAGAELHRALDLGMLFKGQPHVFERRMSADEIRDRLVTELPAEGLTVEAALDRFIAEILPLCKNEASPRFLGFGDTGDDPAALVGGVLAMLTQQNMINQSFDSPSATFIEIAVLRWLRELIGYRNLAVADLSSVWDVGGVVTYGGTTSNAVAMLLAREAKAPGTMQRGVADVDRFGVVVPRGIGHYSVKSALAWIGVGARVIEAKTRGFRYDLHDLVRLLAEHRGRVMAVVAYAGDSRTQTVDHLREVHDVVRAVDPAIWLHADACWGLVATFSDALRHLVAGIELFDSVTVDPHKVMAVPYGLSALLVRRPDSLRMVASHSDLIMQEDFAFGQATPFIGTKDWSSLKLWMMMVTNGRTGLAEIAERRITLARRFSNLVDERPGLRRLHEPELAAVAFICLPSDLSADGCLTAADLEEINVLNRRVHERILEDGRWYLHHFTLPDDNGVLRRGEIVHALRFMANNPRLTDSHMTQALDYVAELCRLVEACDE